jgi:hypothetical protein
MQHVYSHRLNVSSRNASCRLHQVNTAAWQLDRVPSRILFGGRAMQIIDSSSTFACYPNDLATATVCVLIVDYGVQAVPSDHGPCLPVPACRVYSNSSGPTRTTAGRYK